ncbi:ATP-binding protein [Rhodopila sp.]|uniref:sensor histidine kinase n=1 Tax=Rhodopila sp. TaxID=2480087 RepID=UPI003D14A777
MKLGEAARTTTFLWSVGIAIALIAQSTALSGLFYWWTARHATARVTAALQSECRSLQRLDLADMINAIRQEVAADVHRVHLVGLFGPNGQSLAGNIATLPPTLDGHTGPLTVGLMRTDIADTSPNASLGIACPGTNGNRLVVAYDMDALDYIHTLIEQALILIAAPAACLAAILGLILSLRAQRRFRLVLNAIEDVIAGHLQRRLPVRSSPDPFDRLSRAVNAMLDRLEEAFNDLAALGDDLAHELRTPLTRLRARLDRGYHDARTQADFREVGERATADVNHALSIVSAILRIRSIEETRRESAFARINARDLLRQAAELYGPIAELRAVAIEVEAGPSAYIMADRDLMMEAICNLIDNAIKFSPEGGLVQCRLRVRDEDVEAISIADNGPGIAPAERNAVFRRFHRGAGPNYTSEGHGIGLSLVAAIVRLHRFSIGVHDAAPGCEMTIKCNTDQPAVK